MKTTMTRALGTASRLAALAVLLAACGTVPTTPPTRLPPDAAALAADDGCGPCCDRDPAAEAGATQGVSPDVPANPYVGKDAYANTVVQRGTVLYSLTPGAPPRFAVVEQTLRDAGGSWQQYYALVQVTTDPGTDTDGRPRRLREAVQAFHVTEHVCAAQGIARANPQFGAGGGTQYYISTQDTHKLRPGDSVPITRWSVLEIDAR